MVHIGPVGAAAVSAAILLGIRRKNKNEEKRESRKDENIPDT